MYGKHPDKIIIQNGFLNSFITYADRKRLSNQKDFNNFVLWCAKPGLPTTSKFNGFHNPSFYYNGEFFYPKYHTTEEYDWEAIKEAQKKTLKKGTGFLFCKNKNGSRGKTYKKWSPEKDSNKLSELFSHKKSNPGIVLPLQYVVQKGKNNSTATRVIFHIKNQKGEKNNTKKWTIEQKDLKREDIKGKHERLEFLCKKVPILQALGEQKTLDQIHIPIKRSNLLNCFGIKKVDLSLKGFWKRWILKQAEIFFLRSYQTFAHY